MGVTRDVGSAGAVDRDRHAFVGSARLLLERARGARVAAAGSKEAAPTEIRRVDEAIAGRVQLRDEGIGEARIGGLGFAALTVLKSVDSVVPTM